MGHKGKHVHKSDHAEQTKQNDHSEQAKEELPELQEYKIWTHPLEVLGIFSLVIVQWAKDGWTFISKHLLPIVCVALVLILPHVVEGPHSGAVRTFDDLAKFIGWWVGLGILSSIGLGTGLHTFVLYLAPHMAKYAMVVYKCKGVPERINSRLDFHHYGACPRSLYTNLAPSQQKENFTTIELLMGVYAEALLWGFGTAIGELPPYLVSRAARLTGKNEEEELKEIEQQEPRTLVEKAKYLIYRSLQKHAFLTVLACASIPNPLFDLAGIMCGHFLIPFHIFFIATSIGKALIKTTMQSMFVVSVFYGSKVDALVSSIESMIPFLGNKLTTLLNKQRETLNLGSVKEGGKGVIGTLWDIMLTLMIGYFVLSLVHSAVHDYRVRQQKVKSK